jgi:NADH-quinone oxidoreductase subunit G
VWFLKKTPSVCPNCANGCNITVNHYRDRIWRLMPRRNDDVNQTWMCDEGRLNYRYVNSPERLRQPLLRRDGQLEPCEWEEAIAAAASRLRRAAHATQGHGIGVVASPHLTNEEHFRFRQVLQVLGVPNIDVAVSTGPSDNLLIKAEKAANARGARELGLQPTADGVGLPGMLEAAASGRITVLYVCGADLWKTADRELLTKALERVEYLIVQDIFRSPLAERAHLVLPSATFAEKVGTFTNHAGRVQRLERAIPLQDGQFSDGEIFTRLLRQFSEGPWTFQPDGVLTEIAATVPAYAGLSYARIGPLGCGLADAGAGAPG